jgi:hypothetical protein
MTDGVDARVHDEEVSSGEPDFDRSLGHPERRELATRDHAVLPRRQLGDLCVESRCLL